MTSHELALILLNMPDCEIVGSVDADNITCDNGDKVFAESIIEAVYDKRHKHIVLHFEDCSANFKFQKEV